MNADGPEKEPREFFVERVQASVESGVKGVDAAGEFFPEAIHLLVKMADHFPKFPEPAGMFLDFAFDVGDAFFECGHRVFFCWRCERKYGETSLECQCSWVFVGVVGPPSDVSAWRDLTGKSAD